MFVCHLRDPWGREVCFPKTREVGIYVKRGEDLVYVGNVHLLKKEHEAFIKQVPEWEAPNKG